MEAVHMKLVGAISAAVLSLTLGVAVPAYAQQEQHDQQEENKAKPAQDEKKAQPEKPAKQEEKNAQQEKNSKPEEKNAQQQEKNSKPEEKNAQQEKNSKAEEKNAQQQAKPEQQAQREGGNGGGRIPEDRYKANFGQEHRFRVSESDSRDRRFQYGGYSFGFVDPWPTNWLYTQDVYVIEIDGVYYLCNAMYPGVNITLSVTL
jgi:hypothetical protein